MNCSTKITKLLDFLTVFHTKNPVYFVVDKKNSIFAAQINKKFIKN